MKNYKKEFQEKVVIIFVALVILFFILNEFGKGNYWPVALSWGITLIIAFFLTLIIQIVLQFFTGEYLSKKHIKFKIMGFRVRISLFLIITIVIKLWLF